MKYPERVEILGPLPHETQIGYMAFCIERCFQEARRHARARQQLAELPLLTEGVELLWAYAENGAAPDPRRVALISQHVVTYEKPAASARDVIYQADVALVKAARMLFKALKALSDRSIKPRYVAGALEGPAQMVGGIYADASAARDSEVAVIDDALGRLLAWGDRPFSRAVFDDIPDWERGEVSARYLEGQVQGTAADRG